MARGAYEEHAGEPRSRTDRDADLAAPSDAELRRAIARILDLNGLDQRQWRRMFALMERDDDLRRRIDSLSMPYTSG